MTSGPKADEVRDLLYELREPFMQAYNRARDTKDFGRVDDAKMRLVQLGIEVRIVVQTVEFVARSNLGQAELDELQSIIEALK